MNPAQFRLIRALLGSPVDLCAVGDPNQAIYGWNGADPSLIRALPDLVGDLEVVHLDENHRSSPQVVAAATAALGPTSVAPPRSTAADGPRPVVTAYDDDGSEAEGVASFLLDRAGVGIPWSAHAVLARTHDQLALVRRALERAGIPCRTGSASADAVELATFHRAKGLEWEAVCVVGLEDGFVPIVHATTSETPGRGTPAALCGPHPRGERAPLLVGADPDDVARACGRAATLSLVGRAGPRLTHRSGARVAAGRRTTHRRAAGRARGLTARGQRTAGSARSDRASQIVVSMNTGAWSDGF